MAVVILTSGIDAMAKLCADRVRLVAVQPTLGTGVRCGDL